jgi:hypothetical protein
MVRQVVRVVAVVVTQILVVLEIPHQLLLPRDSLVVTPLVLLAVAAVVQVLLVQMLQRTLVEMVVLELHHL